MYDEKVLTQDELLAALEANYVGYEHVYRLLKAVPKYGNDNDEADTMLQAVSRQACLAASKCAEEFGFDYLLIVNINNFGNVTHGQTYRGDAGRTAAGRADCERQRPDRGQRSQRRHRVPELHRKARPVAARGVRA